MERIDYTEGTDVWEWNNVRDDGVCDDGACDKIDAVSKTIDGIKKSLTTFIGYPLNAAYNYDDVICTLKVKINNVGCPYVPSTVAISSHNIELEVLEFFSDLWGLHKEDVWGYVTSSGTEGNLQGLYVGREYLKAENGGRDPILYTSADSHYSIFKIANILGLELRVIESADNGEMDYKCFERVLLEDMNGGSVGAEGGGLVWPVLINANLGTTMKSGIDNTREIYRILKKHGMGGEGQYYMHCDGALMGFVLPFLESDLLFKKHIHSISISGHKFLGIPFPCGVFLMEKRFRECISSAVEYIGSIDCTISGSRNGHSPLFFKHIIDDKGTSGFKEDVTQCIELAEYLVERVPLAWRNQNSITVVLPKPCESIINKWHLASKGDLSHVVVMPHVTKEMLDDFIFDIVMYA